MAIDSNLYAQSPGVERMASPEKATASIANTANARAHGVSSQGTFADAGDQALTRDATADTGGLLGQARAQSGAPDTSKGNFTGYDAMTGKVNEEETASGRMTRITAEDSPLMKLAAHKGALSAARRGLQNTSIASGASMASMADKATPLAQQDASTFQAQNLANQEAINRASEISTGRETESEATYAASLNQAERDRAAMETDVSKFNVGVEADLAKTKAALGTDVSKFNADQWNSAAQQAAVLGVDVSKFNAAQQLDVAKTAAALGTDVSKFNADQWNLAAKQAAELETDVSKYNVSQEAETARINAAAENKMRTEVMLSNASLNKQVLAGEQAIELQNIQGKYNQIISTNETAARLYDSYFTSLSDTFSNNEISPERAQAVAESSIAMLNSGLAMMQGINNMDLTAYMPASANSPAIPPDAVASALPAYPGLSEVPSDTGGFKPAIGTAASAVSAPATAVAPIPSVNPADAPAPAPVSAPVSTPAPAPYTSPFSGFMDGGQFTG